MTDEAGWKLTPAARARIDAEYARIEDRQAHLPICPCGQRTSNPRGICGKRTPEHDRIVAEARWAK